jgi:hypothetical protein
MTGERREQFNQNVERYRRALLYFARISNWETFKDKAGRLFDYLESIEFAELERRFFRNFGAILFVLIAIAVALFEVDFASTPELLRLRDLLVFTGLGIGSYELFFYINYRTYVRVRIGNYSERRERFVKDIEQDFAGYAAQAELPKAA